MGSEEGVEKRREGWWGVFLSRREIALWVVIGGGRERGTQGKKEYEEEEGGRDRRNCLAGAVWDDSVFDR